MQKRIHIGKVQPEAYKAMMAMEKYIDGTDLKPLHKELIRIRASQLNGCAYCLDMHTADARKLGETEQRIYLIQAWKETELFTAEEKAILALTEEVTQISNHVSSVTYQNAAAIFDETYLAQIIMLIITINMWNRIGIFSQLQPGDDYFSVKLPTSVASVLKIYIRWFRYFFNTEAQSTQSCTEGFPNLSKFWNRRFNRICKWECTMNF